MAGQAAAQAAGHAAGGAGLSFKALSFRVDMALLPAARRVAVEADGPTHFCRNLRTPTGRCVRARAHLNLGGESALELGR